MSEMVERVARAIAKSYRDANTESFHDDSLYPCDLDAARAAIAAMREPTPSMAHAGQLDGSGQVSALYVPGFPAHPVGVFKPHGECTIWQAMIDEALR